jgi:hypothetical protein
LSIKVTIYHGNEQRDLYLDSITGVQVKKPGCLSVGYLEFLARGTTDRVGRASAFDNENTLIFKGKDSHKRALAMKQAIENARAGPV